MTYRIYPEGGGGGGEVIPPGTASGQLLIWDGASWVPSTSGWQTRYEVDFSTLANAGPYANGVNVIDGKSWTMENAASGTWQIVNGAGLRGSPQIACDLNNGFRTAPILTARLIDLDPAIDWTKFAGIRLSAIYSTVNQDSNFKGAIVAISRFGAAAGTDNRWEMTKFWSGALGWLARRNVNGGTTAGTFLTTSTGDDIMQVTLRDLNSAVHSTGISDAGSFPVDYLSGHARGLSQLTGFLVDPVNTINSDLAVLLAASDSVGSVNFTFTVSKLKIETIG